MVVKMQAQHRRFLFMALLSCLFSASIYPSGTTKSHEPTTWINVFVHGITSIKYHLSVQNLINLWCDRVNNTRYETAINIVREDDFMYMAQPMQDLGLKAIDTSIIMPGAGASAFANVYEKVDKRFGNAHATNLYYTFGWSAIMSLGAREAAAKEFYAELTKEVARLKQTHTNVKVRILGFSHGGNVSLSLANSYDNDFSKERLSIDELILVACPIQVETDHLINSMLFKKVYNIYSVGDRVQKIEPFSFKRFLSRRKFVARKDFDLPAKLTQMSIKVMRNSKRCNDHKHQALRCNFNNQNILSGRSHLLRDMSPSHSEMWFFSWTPAHYRPNFPICPFPLASFIPRLQSIVDILPTCPKNPVSLDIRPDQDAIVIKNNKEQQVCPFFGLEEFDELAAFALKYKPEDNHCTLEHFNCRIKTSQEIATRVHKEKRRLIRLGHHPHEATKKAHHRFNRKASHT